MYDRCVDRINYNVYIAKIDERLLAHNGRTASKRYLFF